jgi:hypothetical protein
MEYILDQSEVSLEQSEQQREISRGEPQGEVVDKGARADETHALYLRYARAV